jgi:ComF family protein
VSVTPADRCLAALRLAADALLTVTLAPPCAACRQPLDRPLSGAVCGACWSSVRLLTPPLCRICGDSLPAWRVISIAAAACARCRRRPPAFDRSASVGEYEGALRAIVHAFKYEGRRSLAPRLGRLMRDAGPDLVAGADVAVPVPLHPWRRLRRGFNQATELAHGLGLPVVHAVRRTRSTSPQSGLPAAARRGNVHDAFSLARATARGQSVTGRVVLLVDDVTTTGATLDACARVLRLAGAREVWALTAARAILRGKEREARSAEAGHYVLTSSSNLASPVPVSPTWRQPAAR